jgi:Uma2 family endonuclease
VEGWLEGAPDLAVELVGDGPTATAVARKGLEYLAARARLVWIVDPHEELVMVLTAPNGIRILGAEETLDGGEVLSGFSCKVSEFFE